MNIDSITKDVHALNKNAGGQGKPSLSMDQSIQKNLQNPVQTIHNMESQNLLKEDLAKTLQTEEGKKEFETVLEAANEIIFGKDSHFKFQIHEGTGKTMVKLLENETEKVIKEFPPEKILNVIAGIWELAGIIVDEKA